jgi:gliding motility-associated-like protein
VPTHVFEAPGTYGVKLTVNTNSGCVASATKIRPDVVDVWPLPIAQFMADPVVTSLMYPDVTFHDSSVDAAVIDIDVDGTHYNVPDFTHTFADAGRYNVLLTATSGLGCVDTMSITVFVGDHFFYAPNAFTPNGDGTNEVWLPQVKGARFYHLDVFDRWGQLRFSTTDPKQAWDGKDAAPGVYAYKAWLSEYGPLEKEYNGSIILLR